MPVTSGPGREIEDHEFSSARRGYDTAAVRAFLESVAVRIRDLAQSLERSTADSMKLNQELDLAKLSVRTLEAELVNQRLRHRELSARLELAEALRHDALARAIAAESGRQHAENLLALVEAGRQPAPGRGPPPEVDLRELRQRRPPAEHLRQSEAARSQLSHGPVMAEPGPTPSTIDLVLSDTDRAVMSLVANSFQQTEQQVKEIEEAAEALVETTRAQAQQILDGARQDADRITSSARQIAELWDGVLGAVRDDIAQGGSALTILRAGIQTAADPAGSGPSHGGGEGPMGGERPSRFTTNQARAAATSLHAAARDDLHLAEFWIHEAEQEAGDDAVPTSRSILEEAYQLLMMAEELGHPAADLLELYGDLGRRLQRLLE